jgi:hemoglobin/transferrin/lactoferrin receptor protein
MKHFIFLTLILGLSILTKAQQKIWVKDIQTGKPIDLAVIYAENPKLFVQTNAQGEADITAFSQAEEIYIYKYGYSTVKTTYDSLQNVHFTVYLKSLNYNFDVLVFSATKWQEESNKSTAKISVISPKEVAFQASQTTADLLGITGEVFIQKSQQGGGSPMIRGFATNRLLYSVDGVRMNTAIFRYGNIQNVISLDPFTIENTEILFGPNSVIYGSDAIGGVMSFSTLSPQFSLNDSLLMKGKFVSRYSSANNEYTFHFDVNLAKKKWSSVSSVSWFNYGDLKQGSNGPKDYVKDYYVVRVGNTDTIRKQSNPLLQIPTAYSQANFMQKIGFKPNRKWLLQYAFHYSETTPYGRYDRHNRVKNNLPRYAEWNYGPQIWLMNWVSATNEQKNKFYDKMMLKAAHQYFQESRINRNFNDSIRYTNLEQVDAFSLNADFIKTVNKKHIFMYGSEGVQNYVLSNGWEENIITDYKKTAAPRYPNSIWQTYAVYFMDEWKLNKKFTVNSAARFTKYQLSAKFDTSLFPLPFTQAEINNQALTGSLGAVWQTNDKLIVSGNLATAFRAPNVDDIGKIFDSEPGAVVVPNPNLKAEYAYNADLNFTKLIGQSIKIEATVFYTLLKDAIVRRNFSLNGADSIFYQGQMSRVQALQNAAQSNRYGSQLSVNIHLSDNFTFTTNINYQEGVDEMPDGSTSPARHAAPLFGMAKIDYIKNKLHLQFYSFYQAGKTHNELSVEEQDKTEIYALDENGQTYVPQWVTLNFKAQYKLYDKLILNAGVENITDVRYRPYSSGISAPGRNYKASLIFSF